MFFWNLFLIFSRFFVDCFKISLILLSGRTPGQKPSQKPAPKSNQKRQKHSKTYSFSQARTWYCYFSICFWRCLKLNFPGFYIPKPPNNFPKNVQNTFEHITTTSKKPPSQQHAKNLPKTSQQLSKNLPKHLRSKMKNNKNKMRTNKDFLRFFHMFFLCFSRVFSSVRISNLYSSETSSKT